jgi:hypothetical protein
MAKRVDPLKAKQAKQKKIAAVGAVLLLAVVAFQGPKTLKMLKGPPQATAETVATPTPTPTPGSVPSTGQPVPTDTAEQGQVVDLASVSDSDVPPAAEEGQLATFEFFESKDPFVQQAAPIGTPAEGEEAAAPDDDSTAGDSGPAPDDDSSVGPDDGANGFTGGLTDEERGLGGSGSGSSSGSGSGSGSGSTPTPQEPSEPSVAEATSIAVNGVAEDIALDTPFPKDEPTFVLVSVAKDGKSVQIGIAGGQYATGGATMTLALGKKLTLQNTADGSRYELELKAVAGFPLPKK